MLLVADGPVATAVPILWWLIGAWAVVALGVLVHSLVLRHRAGGHGLARRSHRKDLPWREDAEADPS